MPDTPETKQPATHPTQGMVDDGRKGEPDGTGMPRDTRGAGGGGPVGPKDAGKGLHGGQSGAAYHGPGQLGAEVVDEKTKPASVSQDP